MADQGPESGREKAGVSLKQKHPVIFVGAGPGDPELITVAGRRALEEADLVVYTGSLVSRRMLCWCRDEVRTIDSAGLDLDRIVEALAQSHAAGRKVVRLHTGDPSLYGALHEQLVMLQERNIPFRIIPGVTAAFAAAASLGMEFTLPEVCQSLILTRVAGRTPTPEREDLAALASHGSSLAIYLSAGQAAKVSEALQSAFGPQAPVAVVHRATWPDELVLWSTAAGLAKDMALAGITRQAMILAGPGVAAVASGEQGAKSKLYQAGFSHGYRPDGGGK
jgi:precorrin-4/cobalt-precorrin-4 C11-methyltransferase